MGPFLASQLRRPVGPFVVCRLRRPVQASQSMSVAVASCMLSVEGHSYVSGRPGRSMPVSCCGQWAIACQQSYEPFFVGQIEEALFISSRMGQSLSVSRRSQSSPAVRPVGQSLPVHVSQWPCPVADVQLDSEQFQSIHVSQS